MSCGPRKQTFFVGQSILASLCARGFDYMHALAHSCCTSLARSAVSVAMQLSSLGAMTAILSSDSSRVPMSQGKQAYDGRRCSSLLS